MKTPKRQIQNDLKDIGPPECDDPGENLNLERTMKRVRYVLAPWIHHGGGGFNRFAHSAGPFVGLFGCLVVWLFGFFVKQRRGAYMTRDSDQLDAFVDSGDEHLVCPFSQQT